MIFGIVAAILVVVVAYVLDRRTAVVGEEMAVVDIS
jgi:hypothetical protein